MVDCSPDKCKFEYGGVRFKDTREKLAGSGATRIEYYDYYFCTVCLGYQIKRLTETSNSYQNIKFNATPLPS